MTATSLLSPLFIALLLSAWPIEPGFAAGEFRTALYKSIVDGYYSKTFELTGRLPPQGRAEAAAECIADLMLASFTPDEMSTLDTAARTNKEMPPELRSKFNARYREMIAEMVTASTCEPIAVPGAAGD